MDFIFDSEEKRSSDVELEETFVPKDNNQDMLKMSERVKREKKFGQNANHEAVRLNFISRLIDSVEELVLPTDEEDEEMTFGEYVAFNTLSHYGFVKSV
jgi:hypothetical protein